MRSFPWSSDHICFSHSSPTPHQSPSAPFLAFFLFSYTTQWVQCLWPCAWECRAIHRLPHPQQLLRVPHFEMRPHKPMPPLCWMLVSSVSCSSWTGSSSCWEQTNAEHNNPVISERHYFTSPPSLCSQSFSLLHVPWDRKKGVWWKESHIRKSTPMSLTFCILTRVSVLITIHFKIKHLWGGMRAALT